MPSWQSNIPATTTVFIRVNQLWRYYPPTALGLLPGHLVKKRTQSKIFFDLLYNLVQRVIRQPVHSIKSSGHREKLADAVQADLVVGVAVLVGGRHPPRPHRRGLQHVEIDAGDNGVHQSNLSVRLCGGMQGVDDLGEPDPVLGAVLHVELKDALDCVAEGDPQFLGLFV